MRLLTNEQFESQLAAIMAEADAMADGLANDGILGAARTIKGLQMALKAVWSRFAPKTAAPDEQPAPNGHVVDDADVLEVAEVVTAA